MERSTELEARCRPQVEALLQEVVVRMGVPLENVEGNGFHIVNNGCQIRFRITVQNSSDEREVGVFLGDDGMWRYQFRDGGRLFQRPVDDPSLLVQYFEMALRRRIRNRNPILTHGWTDPSLAVEERLRDDLMQAFIQHVGGSPIPMDDHRNDSMATDADDEAYPVAPTRAVVPAAPSAPIDRPTLWQHLGSDPV